MTLIPMDDSAPSQSSRTFVVSNKMGIHARPAAMIVRITNKYSETEIFTQKGRERINAKSIMALMMLAAEEGCELKFVAIGPHALEVLDDLEELFNKKFEEV